MMDNYTKGKLAYQNGTAWNDNPHDYATDRKAWRDWSDGWRAAAYDAGDRKTP